MCGNDELDCCRTISSFENLSPILASGSSKLDSVDSSTLSFLELLQKGCWEDAVTRLKINHDLAKEWHYGIDKRNPLTNEPGILWKRLPLHIVCSDVSILAGGQKRVVPIGLIQLLIHLYPAGLRAVDPHTGMIPLHLACRSCAMPGKSKSPESLSSVMLQFVRIALKAFPHSTKVADAAGRLPIHHAIMMGAPFAVVKLLVHQDPGSVLSPDQDGNTPLLHAHRVYPFGDPVMSLLELAWM
jgi:hypothetical protein